MLGSTALAVAARSAAPVVVVHGRRTSLAVPPVVVGVDGRTSSRAALTFAARWAYEHCTRLLVLHAWEGDISLRSLTAVDQRRRDAKAATTRTRLANLTTLLEPVRRAYPTLEVDASVPLGSPVDALVAQSVGAQLVVLGGRGLGSVRGLILGSVSEAVVQQAHCPVAVVHRAGEREE
jgi:nucleotide-binding universal stress UspA family protein